MKTSPRFTQRGSHYTGHGPRRMVARAPEVWQHCISEHRRAMHDGQRDADCAACRELEARAKADGCEVSA